MLAILKMAELVDGIIAPVAAGGPAALSTASGLLLVSFSSVVHDLSSRVLKPQAGEKERLPVGGAVIGLAVVITGIFGTYPPGFVGQAVAFAFGGAAASFFPVIMLGIFSKRVGSVPAVCGMAAGIGFTVFYIIAGVFFEMTPWTFGFLERGMKQQGIGSIGTLLNFAVTQGLTPFFPKPAEPIQEIVDRVREPERAGPAVEIEESPAH